MALLCPDLLSHIVLGLAAADSFAQMSDAASEISSGFIDFTDGNELPALILYDLTRLEAAPLKLVARHFFLFTLSEVF